MTVSGISRRSLFKVTALAGGGMMLELSLPAAAAPGAADGACAE